MAKSRSRNDRSGSGRTPASPADGVQAECDRLKQRVEQLTIELDQARRSLAAVEVERDAFRRKLYESARDRVRPEDWQNLTAADFPVSSAEVAALLDELERS